MTLYEKIIKLYPFLNQNDFIPPFGTIFLQNDSDGRGDYIKSWKNSNPEPTKDQLDLILE